MAVFKLQIEVELQFDTEEEVVLDPAVVQEALQGLAMDYPVFVKGERVHLEGEFNVLSAGPTLLCQPECVITGCALCNGGAWVAADLFDAGDWWVVNGNCQFHGNGSASPQWLSGRPTYTKNISIIPGAPWFERRGVFVIHKSCAVLNQAALDYIK